MNQVYGSGVKSNDLFSYQTSITSPHETGIIAIYGYITRTKLISGYGDGLVINALEVYSGTLTQNQNGM